MTDIHIFHRDFIFFMPFNIIFSTDFWEKETQHHTLTAFQEQEFITGKLPLISSQKEHFVESVQLEVGAGVMRLSCMYLCHACSWGPPGQERAWMLNKANNGQPPRCQEAASEFRELPPNSKEPPQVAYMCSERWPGNYGTQ